MKMHPVFGCSAEYIPGLSIAPSIAVQKQNFSESDEGLRKFGEFKRYKLIKKMPHAIVHQGYDDKFREAVTLLHYIKIEDAAALAKETSILRSLNDTSILKYHGIVYNNKMEIIERYLSFESFEFFLSQLLCEAQEIFDPSVIKGVMNQLLMGLKYLHEKNIVHRDITPTNLVITEKGVLKISNFRSAKMLGERSEMILTAEFRYQPVNVLLESETIYTADDIWSATCIFAELLLKKKLFKSKGKENLLNDIFSILGFPSNTVWPGFVELPGYKLLHVRESPEYYNFHFLGKYFKEKQSLDLLRGGFIYRPDCRFSAEEFLMHSYFQENPIAITPKCFGGMLHGKSFKIPVEYE